MKPSAGTVFYLTQQFPARGERAYYYVMAKRGMEKKLLALMEQPEAFDLTELGAILASGYGEPPALLKQRMAARYDVRYY